MASPGPKNEEWAPPETVSHCDSEKNILSHPSSHNSAKVAGDEYHPAPSAWLTFYRSISDKRPAELFKMRNRNGTLENIKIKFGREIS